MGTLLTRTARQLVSASAGRSVIDGPWHRDSAPGILDFYPAAVGFSLRQAKASATNCVTIRRSTDSTETVIGFRNGLVDTAAVAAFCGAGSGFVRRWWDQVGTNHAEQTNSLLQPRIYNAGAQEVNEFGKPCIRFLDGTAATIGWHLALDPWHTASQVYVGHFEAYSLGWAGAFPHLLGSSPLDRGFVSTHFNNTLQTRAATVRSTLSVGNGSVLSLNQTYVRHGCADRSRLKTFLDKSVSAAMDVADANSDFQMPTKYWLGSSDDITTIAADIKMSEFIGYAVDQSSNQLLIRSNMFDYWRS